MVRSNRLFTLLLIALLLVVSVAPLSAQDDVPTYYGAWPYEAPPNGHFNTFATRGYNLSIYEDLFDPPLAVLMWASGEYEGMFAETFGYDDDGNYVVTVNSGGYTWSDGTPISADDIMTTFNIFRLRGDAVWRSLTGIERVDDMTVKFLMDAPSSVAERQILTSQIRPHSVYGDFAARAAELFDQGMTGEDQEVADLLTELVEFRPETLASAGPFVLDVSSVGDARLTFNLNPGGIGADTTRFERVVLWNGETDTVTPLVANGEAHYITHGLPPTTEQAFVDQGIDILRTGMFSGPAIYFNHSIYPLNVPEVRQAIAMVIDREQNGFVSLGESGVPVELMMGFSDSLADLWLTEETIDNLNTYDFDPEAATALLEGIGFTMGDDDVWVDDQGNPLAFELTFPQEFADWSAAAEHATESLNDFGFQITARGVQFQQHLQEVFDGNFQLAIRNWGIGDPLPGLSYLQPYDVFNGQGLAAGEAGGGMQFDTNVTYSGGEIDVRELAIQSGQGTDVEEQRAIVDQLALSFNELLPIVPLWERFTNNALNREFLDAPEFSDPIYVNDTTLDAWMPYLIITGGIGPAAAA